MRASLESNEVIWIVDITGYILKTRPSIKTDLRISNNKTAPEVFVRRTVKLALFAGAGLGVLSFFFVGKAEMPLLNKIGIVILALVGSFLGILMVMLNSPKAGIRKRQKEIDREILFAGRYLLIRLQSGSPLINTISDAAKGTGSMSKYFREIMYEIDTGTPLEDALENARKYSASEKFKRLLWQLVVVLKTGAEITGSLKETVRSIANQQAIEIKAFGKKLSSILLFYMVIGCVAPSLGLTMLVIIFSFIGLPLPPILLVGILFFLAFVQVAFIILVKASRPMVDL